MMRCVKSAVLLSTLLGGCQSSPPSHRQPIIVGQDCDASELPATVGLIADAKLVFFGITVPFRAISCTGTLIAPDTVLTAAHCVDPQMLSGGLGATKDEAFYISFEPDLTALVTDPTKLPGGKLPDLPKDAHKASAWIWHPDASQSKFQAFQGGLTNLYDVALVFLEQPVQTVKPAVVITAAEAKQVVVGQPVRIAGWGQNIVVPFNPFVPDPPGSSGVKMCAPSFINEVGAHEMQIGYVRTGRKCHGDSGGPTYMRVDTHHRRADRVIGITSHAYLKTGQCTTGGVDTRVDAWLDWINQEMIKACRDGRRSWCQVQGIIPPSFYDSPQDGKLEPDLSLAPDLSPEPDAEVTGDTGPEPDAAPTVDEGDGCSCRVARAEGQVPLALLALLAVLATAVLLRRRRSTD